MSWPCTAMLHDAESEAFSPLLQVYVEDKDFLSALCRAATAENKTTPVLVHITVSTGAVSPHGPKAF